MKTSRMLLDLDRPQKWPTLLLSYLDAQHDLFLDWKTEQSWVTGPEYDEAIDGLADLLQPYEITGWHCTRLTNMEAEKILRNGMQPPDATMLARRIDALEKADQITPDVAPAPQVGKSGRRGEPARNNLVLFLPSADSR